MKILEVNYTKEIPRSDVEQAKRSMDAAEKIAGMPGLIWKIWCYDEESSRAVSYYLFDSEESARAWGDGPLRSVLGAGPGVSDITTQYFDIDTDLSAVTRAPLG